MKYLTKKQVRALLRRFDRFGESPLKPKQCRKVNNRNVILCRDKKGYYMLTSPHDRARAPGQAHVSRSRRLSPYYHDE